MSAFLWYALGFATPIALVVLALMLVDWLEERRKRIELERWIEELRREGASTP